MNYIACQIACIAMKILKQTTTFFILSGAVYVSFAQEKLTEITARNIGSLDSVAQINFADLDGEFEIGWFAVNGDASEFIIFDRDMTIFQVSTQGNYREAPLIERSPDEIIAVLDAFYLNGVPTILFRHKQNVYINQHLLSEADDFIALFRNKARDEIIVEAVDSEGVLHFLRYSLSTDEESLTFLGK